VRAIVEVDALVREPLVGVVVALFAAVISILSIPMNLLRRSFAPEC
jgi:hypothetical protein